MATTGGKDREGREARERARVYQARQEFHEGQVRRNRRDTVLASVIGGVIILAAIGAQVGYFTLGPGTPAPSPTSTETPAPTTPASMDPSAVPDPTTTTPAETATPEPSTTP